MNQPVVIVTGAAGNLGRAAAHQFQSEGAQLVLIDSDERGLASVAQSPNGPQPLLAVCDLQDAGELARAVESAVRRFGRIDALCNIAGGFRMGPAVHETTPQLWADMMQVNAVSVLNTARAVVPAMLARRAGAIVNVAAGAGLKGAAGQGAYSASKAAVMRLTEAMAAELGPQGVRVNCVLPAILDTPQNRSAMPAADTSGWVDPADAARVIAFLGGPLSRAVHGACIALARAAA